MTFRSMPPAAHATDGSNAQAIAEASRLMKQGIHLLSTNSEPDTISEALQCFDRARSLRQRLPVEAFPSLRYDLAACWLNRAEVLFRYGDATQIPVALRAYDEAIALLRSLPLGDDPGFPRRLAIAHQNRGLALQALRGSSDTETIAAFTEAIRLLEHDDSALVSDRPYLLAATWLNLASARVSDRTGSTLTEARQAALRAKALVKDLEANDADAAEVGLTARHVLCRTIAATWLSNANSADAILDEVHEATDLADEGLALARQWEQSGSTRFRAVAIDLFRFGARVYARHQPHFLREFVFDYCGGSRTSVNTDSNELGSVAENRRCGSLSRHSTGP